ncbi:uncharacterized protein [Lepeophtheirus salmonis]|uniref:uncharacterized protein n=1 Tax=Lepeophtheirus salmonis TaxID=72036 RepID=UPI001AE7BDCE|nr:flocculation protein FLO11-like [Lepeophtheirus salmonis]
MGETERERKKKDLSVFFLPLFISHFIIAVIEERISEYKMWKGLVFISLIAVVYAGIANRGDDICEFDNCQACVKDEKCYWDGSCGPLGDNSGSSRECPTEESINKDDNSNNTEEEVSSIIQESEKSEEYVSTIIPDGEKNDEDSESKASITTVKPIDGDVTENDSESEATTLSGDGGASTTPKTTPLPPKSSTTETSNSSSDPTTTPTASTTPTAPTTITPSTGNTTTTTASTTTEDITTTSTTTSSTPIDPENKSSFDGWSFFGGILLTVGFFSIGFVGLKYYRVRSRTDADYNRF